jgi:hypothetical protein
MIGYGPSGETLTSNGERYRHVVIERVVGGVHNCTHCGMLCQNKYASYLSGDSSTDPWLQHQAAAITRTLHEFDTPRQSRSTTPEI